MEDPAGKLTSKRKVIALAYYISSDSKVLLDYDLEQRDYQKDIGSYELAVEVKF